MRPVNLLIEAAAVMVVEAAELVMETTGVGEGPQNSSVFYDTIHRLASTPPPLPCVSLCNFPLAGLPPRGVC